jgi:hypothetical protein
VPKSRNVKENPGIRESIRLVYLNGVKSQTRGAFPFFIRLLRGNAQLPLEARSLLNKTVGLSQERKSNYTPFNFS